MKKKVNLNIINGMELYQHIIKNCNSAEPSWVLNYEFISMAIGMMKTLEQHIMFKFYYSTLLDVSLFSIISHLIQHFAEDTERESILRVFVNKKVTKG